MYNGLVVHSDTVETDIKVGQNCGRVCNRKGESI